MVDIELDMSNIECIFSVGSVAVVVIITPIEIFSSK